MSAEIFFTNEKYTLMLPVDDNIDTEGYIFMGHIFYENTMVMNFLRGLVCRKPRVSAFSRLSARRRTGLLCAKAAK